MTEKIITISVLRVALNPTSEEHKKQTPKQRHNEIRETFWIINVETRKSKLLVSCKFANRKLLWKWKKNLSYGWISLENEGRAFKYYWRAFLYFSLYDEKVFIQIIIRKVWMEVDINILPFLYLICRKCVSIFQNKLSFCRA